jgi:hypothetical protein
MDYDWGDLAPAVSQIIGRVVDSQPGKSEKPLWNLLHRVNVPIRGASLKLQSPVTGAVYETRSHAKSDFSFIGVPNGVYVLHVDWETSGAGKSYGQADLLVRKADGSKANSIAVVRRDASGGSCEGIGLELQTISN